MNEIKIFNNPEFGEIRTTLILDEPYFVGKDVAVVLGYAKPTDAIRKHVDNVDRGISKIETPSGVQNAVVINESGLYSLILSSKMPRAKEFKHWVTSEILPSIRKHGVYMTDNLLEKTIQDPDFLINILKEMKEEKARNAELEAEKQQMLPKAIFADAVSVSDTSILVGELAKVLRQNGVSTGQQRLFQRLRDDGYLIKGGSSKNMPTQRSMEMGLFEIKEGSVSNPDGSVRITKTTKVTGKGQIYFVNKFLKEDGKEL